MHDVGTLQMRVLPALLARAPLTPEKVAFAWTQAVGPAMGRASSATLEGATLTVRTTDPSWSREIARARPLILARVQLLLGHDVVGKLVVARG